MAVHPVGMQAQPSSQADGRGLRVCLATMAPFLGGAEIAAERLAVGLLELGHEVTMVLGRRGEVGRRMEAVGLSCRYASMALTDKWRPWDHLRSRAELGALLRRGGFDLVHSNDLPTHQAVSGPAVRLGLPCICHHRFPFERAAIDWMLKYGSDYNLFVSQYLRDDLSRNSPLLEGMAGRVVHDGLAVPEACRVEDRDRARRELDLPLDRVLVVFTGQIIERKGVETLLRAWMSLEQDVRDDAELVIVGDDLQGGGAYRRRMEALAAEVGCPARFPGFQPDPARWLTAADIAVVPSLVEPLGNATLEAMALGRPVVASRVGGIPEMVLHGETGLLVPPAEPGLLSEALGGLIRDGERREALGRAAHARCLRLFSSAAHARAVASCYHAILDSRYVKA